MDYVEISQEAIDIRALSLSVFNPWKGASMAVPDFGTQH